jgi:hypothetical protein
MKKLTVLITLVLVSLIVFNSCSKETTEKSEQSKMIMSSGQENFWCDDEYCYWIDPELLENPELPSAPHYYGPRNKEGIIAELNRRDPDGNVIKMTAIICPDPGSICGDIQSPDADGVLRKIGLYLDNPN